MEKIELPTHISGDWWNGMGPISIKVNGDPLNLTNTLIKMQIRRTRRPNESVLAEWTTEDGTIEFVNPINGSFLINGRQLTLPPGNLFSDVQVQTVDGRVFTIIPEIVWNVINDITR